jgi:hypothetical protein
MPNTHLAGKNHAYERKNKMIKQILLLFIAVFLSLAGLFVVHAGEYQTTSHTNSAEFERIKQLAGVWEGTSSMGKEGEKIRVEYRLTAGGSALVETLFPGSAEEMVSVYHDQKGKLAMTHYCMLRNQPSMTLRKADARTIELVFSKKGNAINPAKEKHMHAVSITFTDTNHITQKWTMFEKGKNTGEVTLTLARVR